VASVHVVKPGLLTTVQDRGRWGFQALGVSVAGPMDPVSHRIANALAGNAGDAAALEVTLVGPELVFDDERIVAVAGAEFEIAIDRQPVSGTGSFVVPAGATLRFGHRLRGTRDTCRRRGIDTPPVLGSRATHLPSAMGAWRPSARGGRSPVVRHGPPAAPCGRARAGGVPNSVPDGRATSASCRGPNPTLATAVNDALQSAPYRIAPSSNRMGFRLSGPPLAHTRGADVISDATPLGVVQVPASGQPILLMADRQTSGGYPKIATVITADIGLAGQLGPGDTIAFAVCCRVRR
jgi:biotin-dependent carboxylase-like uncharacterized protein